MANIIVGGFDYISEGEAFQKIAEEGHVGLSDQE